MQGVTLSFRVFCIKCLGFFTAEDSEIRARKLKPDVITVTRIFWRTKCPKCGTAAMPSQLLTITRERAKEDFKAIIDALEWMLTRDDSGVYTETGQPLESDDECVVAITPISLNYDHLHRDYWHPFEWDNIAWALDSMFGTHWRSVVDLPEDPIELGCHGEVALYGQLYHGQPFYFLGKAGRWNQSTSPSE